MAPHFSRPGTAWAAPRAVRALVVLSTVAVAALAGAGCAGSGAPPPVPTDPGISRGPAAGRAPAGGDSAPRLDPSEEITPEELASIPEPLPATSTPLKGAQNQPMAGVAQPPSEAPSGASQPPGTTAPTATLGPQVWRVQIYASERREEAERVRGEATLALAVPGTVDREGAFFKVRLGRFATEAEAQTLREQAIEAGYSGAFRIKTTR